MLLSKTIIIKWNPRNKNYYINIGYQYTKMSEEFQVNVEHLTNGSHAKVNVKCDNNECNKIIPVVWKNYKRYIKDNNEYYCNECALKMFGIKNQIKTKLENGKSFEQWCLENDRQDVLDRWDYNLNGCQPNGIGHSTNKKYYFKCPRKLHKSELKGINNITNKDKACIRCNQCNSFAQWGIDNLGDNFLDKYWDWGKNIVNPWEISFSSSKKTWIKCQEKDYHGSYHILPNTFTILNIRCSYCGITSSKVHPIDSLGTLFPQVLEIWSDKNKKSPYAYAPKSNQEVYWKCLEGVHKDYKRKISGSNFCGFRCPECQYSEGEQRISQVLDNNNFTKIKQNEYNKLNKIKTIKYYIPQKEFDGLLGISNGLLSYDFYLPQYNLLIEYQGEFHDGTARHQTKKQFKTQQEHDRRKKEYAKQNNIRLLEIWYWDFDKIEEILKGEYLLV